MKILIFFELVVLLVYGTVCANNYQDFTDNEFAEFEDFDSEDELVSEGGEAKEVIKEFVDDKIDVFETDDEDESDVVVEDDSEFEHFQDTEEFEGYTDTKEEKLDSEPKITITTVPIHFRANWDSYWLEILMVAGLVVYFLNFVTGKSKNTKLANIWFQSHKALLEDNFSLVGNFIKIYDDLRHIKVYVYYR